jgi:peptidoglycan/xylan/chitin deacetylase (PgdA/CDA1 family)
VLQDLGIRATFFLSGRSLHGLGPYWWTLVDRSVREIGLDATARLLGRRARTLAEIAQYCRSVAMVRDIHTREVPPVMTAADMRALARAGMTIGFHTLRHPLLPRLDDAGLERAMREGREALAAAVGAPVDLLAYPYGIADNRVARAAAQAGYRAAFTAEWRAVSRDSNPYLMSRWQPGPVSGPALLSEAVLRLNLRSAARRCAA